MTKTKKIICIALAVLMIAGAVFFAVYNKIGKTYRYDKINDYSKYITIGEVEGLSFFADDCEIEVPTAEDVTAKIAANLRGVMADSDKNVTDPAAVIGAFDEVYVNFYGSYVDGESVTHFFVAGSRMDKEKPVVLYVESGASSEYFANSLLGKNPNPDAYKLKATGAEGDETVIDADDVVYINYTWARYRYQEDGTTKDEETKETNTQVDTEHKLITSELRLDLAAVPAYFPAGFKDEIVGKTAGSLGTLTFDNVEVEVDGNPVNFCYEYTVTVNRVIDTFHGYEIPYHFADDATDKDLEGNELKGKDVTFHVVISYFNDVPDLDKTYPVDPEDENSEQESVLLSKLNFDETAYYTENVKEKDDWLALEENAGKTEDDYKTYLKEQYSAMVEKQLKDTYDGKRKDVASKPMWEKVKEQVSEVNAPKRATKLTKKDLLSQFKYVFNNATFEGEGGKTVSYRTQYGSFNKFMAACYKDDDVTKALGLDTNAGYKKAIEDGKTWSECVDAAVAEIVENKLLMYALYARLGDEVKIDDAAFDAARNQMYLSYYLGYTNTLLPDSALRESLMFDNVMQYIYDHANVQWESDGATP